MRPAPAAPPVPPTPARAVLVTMDIQRRDGGGERRA
jgi:hypothetical protein